ncbi:hypothetical protein [Streptomyces virginiae]|uniref:hypothetical protein n=1 Tax=Streptomyces virginiae TaxID=1961 RepID=UPI003319151B
MPSNAEVTHWFHKVRLNIEQHFPDGVAGPIGQMREMAASFPATLAAGKASAYSLVARRAA